MIQLIAMLLTLGGYTIPADAAQLSMPMPVPGKPNQRKQRRERRRRNGRRHRRRHM